MAAVLQQREGRRSWLHGGSSTNNTTWEGEGGAKAESNAAAFLCAGLAPVSPCGLSPHGLGGGWWWRSKVAPVLCHAPCANQTNIAQWGEEAKTGRGSPGGRGGRTGGAAGQQRTATEMDGWTRGGRQRSSGAGGEARRGRAWGGEGAGEARKNSERVCVSSNTCGVRQGERWGLSGERGEGGDRALNAGGGGACRRAGRQRKRRTSAGVQCSAKVSGAGQSVGRWW